VHARGSISAMIGNTFCVCEGPSEGADRWRRKSLAWRIMKARKCRAGSDTEAGEVGFQQARRDRALASCQHILAFSASSMGARDAANYWKQSMVAAAAEQASQILKTSRFQYLGRQGWRVNDTEA